MISSLNVKQTQFQSWRMKIANRNESSSKDCWEFLTECDSNVTPSSTTSWSITVSLVCPLWLAPTVWLVLLFWCSLSSLFMTLLTQLSVATFTVVWCLCRSCRSAPASRLSQYWLSNFSTIPAASGFLFLPQLVPASMILWSLLSPSVMVMPTKHSYNKQQASLPSSSRGVGFTLLGRSSLLTGV